MLADTSRAPHGLLARAGAKEAEVQNKETITTTGSGIAPNSVERSGARRPIGSGHVVSAPCQQIIRLRPASVSRRRPTSYQLGSILFTLGTTVWLVESMMLTAAVDPVAAVYLVGCILYQMDAFGISFPCVPSAFPTLGTLLFLSGTVLWVKAEYGATGSLDPAAAAYGVGCLCYLRSSPRSVRIGASSFLIGSAINATAAGLTAVSAIYLLGALFFMHKAIGKEFPLPRNGPLIPENRMCRVVGPPR